MSSETAIKIDELSKVYPNGTKAVDNFSLEVSSDDLLIIIGCSGAGKSTLLRCMNRLIEPTSGSISLMGKDITHVHGKDLRETRERVGMIFQQFNLVSRMTVLDNVLAGRLPHCKNLFWRGASNFRVFPKSEKEFAFECLRKVGIEALAYQRADNLSGGQQQRVAIARALAQEPVVMLADEPVASLDPASSEAVMEALHDIQERDKIPVVVNLHQIDLAKHYAKRVVGMLEGRKVFEGSAAELTNDMLEQIYDVEVDLSTGRPKTKKLKKPVVNKSLPEDNAPQLATT